jgi:hypothetical protein
MSSLPSKSGVNLFRDRESVIHLDAEISDGTLDLGVTQKELHGSQVAGSAMDQGQLGSAKRMLREPMRVQSNVSDPM